MACGSGNGSRCHLTVSLIKDKSTQLDTKETTTIAFAIHPFKQFNIKKEVYTVV
jgi:hypothetical protein